MYLYLRLLWRIFKRPARVEYAQVIHKLDIPSLKLERNSALFGGEMQRVEGFGLRFCNGRDVCAAR